MFRLEEQDKLVTAEGLYKRALSLDDSNPEAKEAMHNITETIQVSGIEHSHSLIHSIRLLCPSLDPDQKRCPESHAYIRLNY